MIILLLLDSNISLNVSPHCIEVLEKQDRRAVTIKQLNKMQILNTLQERHKYNVVHQGWDTSTHKSPVLIIISSNKMKGYNL